MCFHCLGDLLSKSRLIPFDVSDQDVWLADCDCRLRFVSMFSSSVVNRFVRICVKGSLHHGAHALMKGAGIGGPNTFQTTLWLCNVCEIARLWMISYWTWCFSIPSCSTTGICWWFFSRRSPLIWMANPGTLGPAFSPKKPCFFFLFFGVFCG